MTDEDNSAVALSVVVPVPSSAQCLQRRSCTFQELLSEVILVLLILMVLMVGWVCKRCKAQDC